MGRNQRKNNKCFKIIIIICICLITAFTILGIFAYLKSCAEEKKHLDLDKKFQEINSTYNELLSEKEELSKEKERLDNIDSLTLELKEEVFKEAKKLEDKIQNNETNAKIAYITFDDGPYYSTNTVLKILREKKVKATFFTIGLDKDTCFDNKSESCKDMYKKIVDEGHTIANHTYSHLIFNGLYSSSNSFIREVKKQEELIKERTGVTTNILRFPGGSATANYYGVKNGAISELQNMNYGWVDWTAQDGDGGSIESKEEAWRNLKNSINENIEVVLFHDYNNITISILPEVITYLEDNNYIILPLFYESVKVNK